MTYLIAAFLLILLGYYLPRVLPGDYVTAMYSQSQAIITEEEEAWLKAEYADKESFCEYIIALVTLDWGYSLVFSEPVSDLIFSALPWTLFLLGSAHLLAMIIGFIAGVEAAWRRGPLEKLSVGLMTFLEGAPEIATGILLLFIFALVLGWFPAAGGETAYAGYGMFRWGLDVLYHTILPFITLFFAYLPGNFLLARGSMIVILKSPFLKTAYAKGLPSLRVRYGHGARNALLPVVTRFGLRFSFMLTGALVVETIFSYPGLGTLLFKSIALRDLPLIQAIVLFSSLLVLTVNIALEICYRFLDPRVRNET
ncbi:MAG: ABC transporter permease [Syntrophales bacterium]|nr:ABC transporter permease [Syntrophales bacterium]MDY0045298.1 ABC transporter permease [Syntrophales bacterium]